MSNNFTFTIDGPPIAWKRAGRNKGKTYPTRVKEKRAVGVLARSEMRKAGFTMAPKGVPVLITVVAGFQVPPSITNKERKHRLGQLYHTIKPDSDNLLKLIKDALNGIAWADDCQVSIDGCLKFWTEDTSRTCVKISLPDVQSGRAA